LILFWCAFQGAHSDVAKFHNHFLSQASGGKISGLNTADGKMNFKKSKGKNSKSKNPDDGETVFTIMWLRDTPGVDAWRNFTWSRGCTEPKESCREPNELEHVLLTSLPSLEY
jgi:hypothetical protein